jgi:hypothetical protein
MRGAIPPLLQYVFMSWCLVKHRDNYTFTFTLWYTEVSKYLKGKVAPVFFELITMPLKAYWGIEGIAPHILDLDTRWRWVVSFTPRERPWYPSDRKLGGPENRSGRGGAERNSHPLPGRGPPIFQPIAQLYTTELSRLLSKYLLSKFRSRKIQRRMVTRAKILDNRIRKVVLFIADCMKRKDQ